jgi:hypothetical protein
MPKDFERCEAQGGKMVTISKGGTYRHLCKDKKGKWHAGESHKKKTPKKGGAGKKNGTSARGPKKTPMKRKRK